MIFNITYKVKVSVSYGLRWIFVLYNNWYWQNIFLILIMLKYLHFNKQGTKLFSIILKNSASQPLYICSIIFFFLEKSITILPLEIAVSSDFINTLFSEIFLGEILSNSMLILLSKSIILFLNIRWLSSEKYVLHIASIWLNFMQNWIIECTKNVKWFGIK